MTIVLIVGLVCLLAPLIATMVVSARREAQQALEERLRNDARTHATFALLGQAFSYRLHAWFGLPDDGKTTYRHHLHSGLLVHPSYTGMQDLRVQHEHIRAILRAFAVQAFPHAKERAAFLGLYQTFTLPLPVLSAHQRLAMATFFQDHPHLT